MVRNVPASVLITRPEQGMADTSAKLRAMGFTPVAAPVLRIRHMPLHIYPASVQAVLVTSANAVPALPRSLHGLPAFAVGDATAAALNAAGFQQVLSADGDATDLTRLCAERLDPLTAPVLSVSGARQGFRLASLLRAQKFRVIRRAVYAAEPVAALPEAARAALQGDNLHATLFFSADTARAFVKLLRSARLTDRLATVDALAIGQPAADVLAEFTWRSVKIAARPTQEALLGLL